MTDQPTRRPRPGTPPGKVQACPFVVTCPPGRYAHCQCQASATYPYCDGSHRGTDIKPLKVQIEVERTVVWCACGQSRSMPFCDGSHSGS